MWADFKQPRPLAAEMPPYGKDEENQVLFVSNVHGHFSPVVLLTPADSPELSNSTAAVLSSLQIVIALSAFAKKKRRERAMQSGDANQFSFAEATKTIPVPTV